MKLFDVAASGVQAVKDAATALVTAARPAPKMRHGTEETVKERKARINREAKSGWLKGRPNWLGRGL